MLRLLSPITGGVIIVTGIIILAQLTQFNRVLIYYFALWPISGNPFEPSFRPWQILTYSFLHGGLAHFFLNMFALFMFGGELERFLGSKRILNLYIVSVIGAGLVQLMVASNSGPSSYPTIGASGGVFGLLLAYAMYFPRRRILLLFPPIPMPAWLFVTIYGIVELLLGVTGTMAGVAHFAHLGGMVGAWFLIRFWRGQLPFGRH